MQLVARPQLARSDCPVREGSITKVLLNPRQAWSSRHQCNKYDLYSLQSGHTVWAWPRKVVASEYCFIKSCSQPDVPLFGARVGWYCKRWREEERQWRVKSTWKEGMTGFYRRTKVLASHKMRRVCLRDRKVGRDEHEGCKAAQAVKD